MSKLKADPFRNLYGPEGSDFWRRKGAEYARNKAEEILSKAKSDLHSSCIISQEPIK
ncbi:MAG: hypothetical protein JKY14_13725 [Paraglaciecola sp.]|nr:hypothetical protein [Paraglaciecola sp.]